MEAQLSSGTGTAASDAMRGGLIRNNRISSELFRSVSKYSLAA